MRYFVRNNDQEKMIERQKSRRVVSSYGTIPSELSRNIRLAARRQAAQANHETAIRAASAAAERVGHGGPRK